MEYFLHQSGHWSFCVVIFCLFFMTIYLHSEQTVLKGEGMGFACLFVSFNP